MLDVGDQEFAFALSHTPLTVGEVRPAKSYTAHMRQLSLTNLPSPPPDHLCIPCNTLPGPRGRQARLDSLPIPRHCAAIDTPCSKPPDDGQFKLLRKHPA